MKKQYLYPQNMRTEAKLWFWGLKDIIILAHRPHGICGLVGKIEFHDPCGSHFDIRIFVYAP